MTPAALEPIATAVDRWRADAGRPLVVGLCGAQGSGKSTIAAALVEQLQSRGIAAVALSLDDLYLTHAERARLAAEVHPLLATRGVPGTHDVGLGNAVLDALVAGRATALPRFDKSRDDRAPRDEWPLSPGGIQVIVFEGWCVGARPQPREALTTPVNTLERHEDPDGRWRAYVNAALAGSYQGLFARIDRLVLLAAPSFAVVERWRGQQEAELRRTAPAGTALMDEAALRRFIQHYERLTRHILAEMPQRADLFVALTPEREVAAVRSR
ncbi:MAG: zeta toxin family protein [Novosphingobium sp.]|nr:zeta toxin family protein [Novosphingobium sp.]